LDLVFLNHEQTLTHSHVTIQEIISLSRYKFALETVMFCIRRIFEKET